MPELRAPECRRTGIEIKPKVRYPDHTEAAIVFVPRSFGARATPVVDSHVSPAHEKTLYGFPSWYFVSFVVDKFLPISPENTG